MTMNRILHASARGARIQRREFNEHDWYTTYSLYINRGSAAPDCVYRIHPDDADLEYGMVSTKLRDLALSDLTPLAVRYQIRPLIFDLLRIDLPYADITSIDFCDDHHEQKSMFLLILAEALADDGM
jgi:hypothetical protein